MPAQEASIGFKCVAVGVWSVGAKVEVCNRHIATVKKLISITVVHKWQQTNNKPKSDFLVYVLASSTEFMGWYQTDWLSVWVYVGHLKLPYPSISAFLSLPSTPTHHVYWNSGSWVPQLLSYCLWLFWTFPSNFNFSYKLWKQFVNFLKIACCFLFRLC